MVKAGFPSGRIQSIDAFRGITIFTMIFVNEVAGVNGIPAWMEHAAADEDAMTFVDVVFPAFLFIVGMSIPFAAAQRQKSDSGAVKYFSHTLWRAISLMIMGIFMVNAERDYNDQQMGISIYAWSLLFYLALFLIWANIDGLPRRLITVAKIVGFAVLAALAFVYRDGSGGPISRRWWGILGLIGWAYLISSILYWLVGTRRGWLFVIVCALFAYHLLGHFAFPGNILYHHLLLSQGGHAVHTGIVLSGVLLSLIFFHFDPLRTESRRLVGAVRLLVAMLIIGLVLRPASPLSKIYATPSWAAFSISCCIAVFILIYLIVDRARLSSWTKLVAPAAVNPLLVYIIPFIVYAFMKLVGLSFPSMFYNGMIGVIWAALYAALVMAIASILTRFGVMIRI